MRRFVGVLALLMGTVFACHAQPGTVTIVAKEADVLGAAHPGAKVLTQVSRGDSYEVIVSRGDWYLIQTPEFVGWLRQTDGRYFGSNVSDNNRSELVKQASPAQGDVVPLKILVLPKVKFTKEACKAHFLGTVALSVEFLPYGGIGDIAVVRSAPYGLVEKAVEAARAIRFEPMIVNGTPKGVTQAVEYPFEHC